MSLIRWKHAHDDADGGGFAGTIATKKTKGFAAFGVQVDVVKHQVATEGFADLLNRKLHKNLRMS
ncbi:hypothetical protein SDC9_197944 [bioreactor metagenome]|uniref:Uncharacterized protein n=1 Tax=bioreactor metagenome TaxID=1076179 RepID=A0A645IG83_9ZZZZ